jgi:hypothetical protein
MADAAAVPIVPGRSCAGCTLCCKLLMVPVLEKPRGVWCAHCDRHGGCTIYPDRPEDCRHFFCGWLTAADLGEEWRPLHAKIVLSGELGGMRLAAYVDPARPDAWRRPPYYATLKRWARDALRNHGQVVVLIGDRMIVVLPDRDVDLGLVTADDRLLTIEHMTPAGPFVEALKVHKDDPRLREFEARQST